MKMHLEGYATAGLIRPLDQAAQKVMFFGKSMSRTRATYGLVQALRNHGREVKWLNMATHRRWRGRRGSLRHARKVFWAYQPDLVFVFCRDLPAALLDEFSAKTAVILWVEEPLQEISQAHLDYFAKARAIVVTNPSKIPHLRQHGIEHVAFSLEGFSNTVHYASPRCRAERDLVYIGGPGPRGERARFLAAVAKHFPLEIYGHSWGEWQPRFPELKVHGPVKPRGYRRLCAQSRIVLGINQVNDDALYFSNRTILTLACRGFHLTHHVPDLDKVFTDGEHLASFRDLDHCLAQIESYLKRPMDRAAIAQAGHDFVHREHRFDDRIADILAWLEGGVHPAVATGDSQALSTRQATSVLE